MEIGSTETSSSGIRIFSEHKAQPTPTAVFTDDFQGFDSGPAQGLMDQVIADASIIPTRQRDRLCRLPAPLWRWIAAYLTDIY